MLDPLFLAAYHPASTRLFVAVIAVAIFALVLPRPAPRPLAAASLGVLVVLWAFDATLIWGTGGASKQRLGWTLTDTGESLLLTCALIGILAAAAAVRAFSRSRTHAGIGLAVISAVIFALWSVAVRYSPVVAGVCLLIGCAALGWAAKLYEPAARSGRPRPQPLAGLEVLLALTLFVLPPACGALYYACLRWGPHDQIDPGCGATLVVPAFLAAVAIPSLFVGVATRTTGRRLEAALALAVLAALLTAGICVAAFLVWFGQNHCGE